MSPGAIVGIGAGALVAIMVIRDVLADLAAGRRLLALVTTGIGVVALVVIVGIASCD